LAEQRLPRNALRIDGGNGPGCTFFEGLLAYEYLQTINKSDP